MKLFTDKNVIKSGGINRITTKDDPGALLYAPLWWQKAGLQETPSGYGAKLTTSYKINFNGYPYRIYCTCYSNSGTCWFISKGRKIIVS